MKSRVVKRLGVIAGHKNAVANHKKKSVVIAGRKKSISLEEAFWNSLNEIASYKDTTVLALLAAIDSKRRQGNLASAIRLFVVRFYREQLAMNARRSFLHRLH
jgi:predicted DNA-binding ribbon-helix-helix protein